MQTGNPSDYKMKDGETVAIGFIPKGAELGFPPQACDAFANISDQNTAAVVSKNSPCRADYVDHHDHRTGRDSVKAVVLVGGEGTRLRPLTYETPKPLLPIANEPFLERQLRWLAHHGVDEVVLSMGYLPDAFAQQFPGGRFGDMKLRYAVEADPLGTAGGIRFAAEGVEDRILVCNGDVLTTLDLTELLRFHTERGAEATIALTEVDDPSAFGVVPTRDDGEVVAFVEKPPPGRAPTQLDQRGHVRARAVGARANPAAALGVDRAGDVPAHARRARALVRDAQRRVLARHRNAREVPAVAG